MENTAAPELLVNARERLAIAHRNLKENISVSKPPVVQELVLALRHIEDAIHRLDDAQLLMGDKNPWAEKTAN